MEKFKYVAVDVDKKRFRGSFLAESESHLREQLRIKKRDKNKTV